MSKEHIEAIEALRKKASVTFHVTAANLTMSYDMAADRALTERLVMRGLEETIGNACNTARDDDGNTLSIEAKRELAQSTLARIISGEYSFGGGGGKSDPFTVELRAIVIGRLAKTRKLTKKAAGEIVKKHGPRIAWAAHVLEREHSIPVADMYAEAETRDESEIDELCAKVIAKANAIVAMRGDDEEVEV